MRSFIGCVGLSTCAAISPPRTGSVRSSRPTWTSTEAWSQYLFGLLYFLPPVLALFTIFLPLSGAGFFGLEHGGPMFTVYLLLVNLPFGIITALVARVIIGKQP